MCWLKHTVVYLCKNSPMRLHPEKVQRFMPCSTKMKEITIFMNKIKYFQFKII